MSMKESIELLIGTSIPQLESLHHLKWATSNTYIDIYQNIYDNLEWMDYYNAYDKDYGFFKELPEYGNNRKFYLPYRCTYNYNRCADLYYILCTNDNKLPKFIRLTMDEGHKFNLQQHLGLMTDELSETNDFYIDYVWSKQIISCPEHNDLPTANKIVKFFDKYCALLNVNDVHTKNIEELCLIIALVSNNFYHNIPDQEKLGYFYIGISNDSLHHLLINLTDKNILIKFISTDPMDREEKITEMHISEFIVDICTSESENIDVYDDWDISDFDDAYMPIK